MFGKRILDRRSYVPTSFGPKVQRFIGKLRLLNPSSRSVRLVSPKFIAVRTHIAGGYLQTAIGVGLNFGAFSCEKYLDARGSVHLLM